MKDLKNKKIAVVLGGWSKERDVSLRTGGAIYKSFTEQGFNVIKFDPAEQSAQNLVDEKVQVAFVALHGSYGEDGCIQGVLETLKIPYTGSGVFSSALCYDKIRTKQILKNYNVLSPRYWVFNRGQDPQAFVQSRQISVPVIAKPNKEGSSFGAVIIRHQEQLVSGIIQASQFGAEVLIEEFIEGQEVTVGVLNGKALPTVEIAPKSGFYDYESKYTPGKTEYFVPARIPEKLEQEMRFQSEEIVKYLGCRGAPRIDYMVSAQGRFYFLEVNTIPGMTETSLLPKAAKGLGIDFGQLCVEILESASLDNA